MRIRRLYIGDFGILRNQTLNDLKNLVVVGGCNRAGKSTFMQVLRYLGYGIPQNKSVPPANVGYMIEADVTQEETQTDYHIRLSGYAEPVCTIAGQDKKISAASLYGLDQFTYHNLFTISLEQLTRIPEGIKDKDVVKLQSALLGAGLADIANIPGLEEKFLKYAAAIGGKDGNLTVKGFSSHVQKIRDGDRRKKAALSQVDEYNNKQKLLSSLQEQEESLRKLIQELKARQDILEIVKSNYDTLLELTGLDSLLERHEGACMPDNIRVENHSAVEAAYKVFRDMKAGWLRQYEELAAGIGNREQAGSIAQLLVKHKDRLQSFYDRLSGLQEIWNSLESIQYRLKEHNRQIIERISRLNAGWNRDNMNILRGLRLDLIEESCLMEAAGEYKSIENKLNQVNLKLDEANSKYDRLNGQVEEWQKNAPAAGLNLYLWAFAVSAAAGLALWFINPYIGLFLGLFGVLGSFLYVFIKGLGQKEAGLRLKELKAEITDCKTLQEKLAGEKELLEKQMQAVDAYLSDVRNKLGIQGKISPDGILEYYRTLADITGRLRNLDSEKEEMEKKFRELTERVNEIACVLSEFDSTFAGTLSEGDKQLTPDVWSEIQAGIKKWHGLMEKAVLLENTALQLQRERDRLLQLSGLSYSLEGLSGSEQVLSGTGTEPYLLPAAVCPEDLDLELSAFERQIEDYLNLCKKRTDYLEKRSRKEFIRQSLERAASSERAAKAAAVLDYQLNNPLELFHKIYNQFPSKEFMEREYAQAVRHIQNCEEQLEKCREEILKTKTQLEQLSMTEELEYSHEMIRQGRTGLFQASYQYAVWKAAAWLCSEIKNGFMNKMKDELLHKADGVLSQLTGGEYRRILPKDDFKDFSFMLQDGSLQDNSSILSRGTREQVFLAVRLGRILDIKPALPVIIDDSFVNFDRAHLKQAVDIICRLSQTHQVFIMTCHPHLVGMLMENGCSAQYWRLVKGQFSPDKGLELMKYLSSFS
ncbi:MAG TPA: AAA family ATPase [Clostridiales bacterium]|nr:AAA family ATPase [Clostridiales bacterium]